MKKTVALILTIVLLLSFAGCGEKKEPKIKPDEVVGLIKNATFEDYVSQMDDKWLEYGADIASQTSISDLVSLWESKENRESKWLVELPEDAVSVLGNKLDNSKYYYEDIQLFYYDMSQEEPFTEIIFSVDKENGTVAPVASVMFGEWKESYEEATPANHLGMFFAAHALGFMN